MRRAADWFEWRTVVPWSAGLIALFAAVHLALAWAVQHELVRAGERRISARVEVDDTRVNLLASRVSLRGLQIANPESPLRNLVVADRCDLQLEPAASLHKQTVIRYGTVEGLRVGTPRETSGTLVDATADSESAAVDWLDEAAARRAEEWLNELERRFDPKLIDDLESVRLADELLQRWPKQAAALEQRVTELRERSGQFQARVRSAQGNPLRNAEFLNSLPKEITKIRDKVVALGEEIEKLPNVADEDRRKIVAAREHDAQLLRSKMQIEPIGADELSAYLLRKQLDGPMGDLLGWLRLIRRLVPADELPDSRHHHRGHDVLFAGCQPAPRLLIRQLQLAGTTHVRGQPLELFGVLTDVADQPKRHDQPIRLRMTARGSLPLELRATIDRTGRVARDQLLVDCGGIVLPKLRLGGSSRLRLSLAPSTAKLQIRVMLEGDKLRGDVDFVQANVKLTPTVSEQLPKHEFGRQLAQALAEVNTLATHVTLGGTLEQPECIVRSDLGPAIAQALHRACVRTVATYSRKLLAESRARVDERLADLDRQIADAQSALEPQLADATDSLTQLSKKVTTERLSLDQLGRRLPADSLFR